MRTSWAPSPTTARNRSSGCFVFWILPPGVVNAELHRGRTPLPHPERTIGATSLVRRLGETSDRTGSPANALVVVMVIAIVAFVAQRIGGVSAVNAFFYPGTIGVLCMLVAYIVTNVGALRFLFFSGRVRAWEAIFPVIALAILVYVIYANVYPVQAFPFNLFPYIVAVWLVVGLAIVLLVPGLARRIGVGLAEREGLAVEEVGRPRR